MSKEHTGLPNTPEEIRAFIGKSFSSLQFGQDNELPHENDTYTLTAHDLISAFQWAEIDAPMSAEPTDDEIIDIAVEPLGIDCDRMPYGVVVFARALLSRYSSAPVATQAQLGEDIIVNCPDNVCTLPLRSSGLTQGPRFVVHVPAQTSASAELECSHCGGTGDVSGEYPGVACPACGGTGKAAPVAAQPDLTQQTLDDVMAGIPARDAEIEALQKENLALLHRAAIDAEVASRLARRLFEISAVISPDTPIAQHDISDLLARVKRVVSTLAQQVDKSPETQEKTVDKSPDLQGHASVIFAKAVAWADARVDAALTQPEQEGYGSACDDADQAHYELVQALRNLREAQHPVSGADGLPIELRGISEAIVNGGGFWRSCSGCHELNEGHDTGPRSKVFGCALGNGCSECGGIGAIWDTTDYDAMADFMAAEYQKRTENTEPVGQDQLRDAAQMIEPSGNSGELAQEFAKRLNDALESLSGEYFNSFNVRMAIKDTVHSFTRIGHEELAKLAISRSQQDAEKVDAALADMVHAMFRSGNSVPVTRITIDRKQYEATIDAARKEQE